MDDQEKKDIARTAEDFEEERAADDEATLSILKAKLRDKEDLGEREATLYAGTELGKIQGMFYAESQSRVAKIAMLKDVKERKLYRKAYGIGTWAGFCKQAGMNHHTVDQEIKRYGELGAEFLASLANLGWSPSEVKALARAALVEKEQDPELASSSQFSEVKIGGKVFVWDEEHKEEILEAVSDELRHAAANEKKARNELAEADKTHAKETKDFEKKIEELEAQIIDPAMPAEYERIFKQIETGVNRVATLTNRLDFNRMAENADRNIERKAHYQQRVKTLQDQLNRLIEALDDTIHGRE